MCYPRVRRKSRQTPAPSTLRSLADNPHRVGHALRNDLDGLCPARRGEYRVIYRIADDIVTVTVIHIAHRRDAYRPR